MSAHSSSSTTYHKQHYSPAGEAGHLVTSALSHVTVGLTKLTKLSAIGSLQGGLIFQAIKRPLHHLANEYLEHKVANVLAIAGSIVVASTGVWLILSQDNAHFTYFEALKLNVSGVAGSELAHKVGSLAIEKLKEIFGDKKAEEIVKDLEKGVKDEKRGGHLEAAVKKQQAHQQTHHHVDTTPNEHTGLLIAVQTK